MHRDSVFLGRKLTGKSHRELHDLGLLVENGADGAVAQSTPAPTDAGGAP